MHRLTTGQLGNLKLRDDGGACRASRGQSLLEFALMLPFMLVLLVGVLDLGRVYFAQVTIFNVAREGVRYASERPANIATAEQRARDEADGTVVTPAALIISTSCEADSCVNGNYIQMTVQYDFQLITTYIVGGGKIRLQASDRMVIFGAN